MLKAVLNFPLNPKALRSLVKDDRDLQLMMPSAKLPFDESEWLAKMNPANGTLSFFVFQKSTIIGHFSFLRVNGERHEAALGLVYLSPEKRGTGTSQKLLLLAEQTAINFLNTKTMLLNVVASNLPAVNLYLKAGYIEYERADNLIRMKKHFE